MNQQYGQPDEVHGVQKVTAAPSFALFEILMGQWIARCVQVAANLGVADALGDSPKSVEELAQATDTHAPTLYRLLRSLASRGIFTEVRPGYFAQTELSAVLRSNQPGSLNALVRTYGSEWQWRAWGDLEYSIRTGKAAAEHVLGQRLFEYLKTHPQDIKLYQQGLTSVSEIINKTLAHVYDFSSFDTLVDVGGGHGSLLMTILASYPNLRGTLFDQAQVIEHAREHIASGVSERMHLVAGDFFVSVPEGGDAYLLKQVLHDWSDEDCIRILKACRQAMKPSSKLLVIDPIVQPDEGPETTFAKLTDLLMLVVHAGRERTAAEFARLFASSGFKLNRIISTESPVGIAEGIPV